MSGGDLHRRHGLHGSLGRRRLLVPADAIDLDLSKLVQQPIKSRAHQKVGHARRKGPQPRPRPIVVVKLEAVGVGPLAVGSTDFASAEYDDGVEPRPLPAAVASAPEWRRAGAAVVGFAAAEIATSSSAVLGDLLDEAAVAVGADDDVAVPNPNEAATSVAPVGRRRGRHESTSQGIDSEIRGKQSGPTIHHESTSLGCHSNPPQRSILYFRFALMMTTWIKQIPCSTSNDTSLDRPSTRTTTTTNKKGGGGALS